MPADIDYQNEASAYVIQNARFMPDSPKLRYHVRYPPYATRVFMAEDTMDLVGMVEAAMRATAHDPNN